MVRTIYPELNDAEAVEGREDILGIEANLFLYDHEFPEENDDFLQSKRNVKEAEFLLRFAYYLTQQGYAGGKLTVLSLYAS